LYSFLDTVNSFALFPSNFLCYSAKRPGKYARLRARNETPQNGES
jgi:hypothetical protein